MNPSDAFAAHAIRLGADDADRFLALRRRGLTGDPDAFRYAPSDDEAVGIDGWRERLARDRVVGVEIAGELIGVGGYSRVAGAKLDHKGLIWGMFVRPEARGTGAASAIMEALIEAARGQVRQLRLTVMADNARARAFYVRHGFELYGIEPGAVRREGVWANEALMWRRV